MEERDVIFTLLRSALRGGGCEPIGIGAPQWWSVFRLLQQNHVAALCCDAAVGTGLPREVMIPWMAERDQAVRWHRYQRQVQDEIVQRMQAHGIRTLVLKGTHTAQYYPQAEVREFGDVDLYFYDRHAEADEVARRELHADITAHAHHHTKYNYRGVTVESHSTFINRSYPRSNRRYEALLEELAPSPTFEVLFLLRHMAGHFAAGRITLRDLCDWALTCRALEAQVDWPRVQQTAEAYGMEGFVEGLNTLAQERLGMAAPMRARCYNEWLERDLVYGNIYDHEVNGAGRLWWKVRRWRALRWHRQLAYREGDLRLLLTSLAAHASKPHSILNKL